MNECVQCRGAADMHIAWVDPDDKPTECDVCSECMGLLWNKFKNTKWGQTIQIGGMS